MLIILIVNVIILILGAIFSPLPRIETLPSVMGYDIDTALVSGVGQLRSVMESIWVLNYLIGFFIALLTYYAIKATLKFFLGSRAPGIH